MPKPDFYYNTKECVMSYQLFKVLNVNNILGAIRTGGKVKVK